MKKRKLLISVFAGMIVSVMPSSMTANGIAHSTINTNSKYYQYVLENFDEINDYGVLDFQFNRENYGQFKDYKVYARVIPSETIENADVTDDPMYYGNCVMVKYSDRNSINFVVKEEKYSEETINQILSEVYPDIDIKCSVVNYRGEINVDIIEYLPVRQSIEKAMKLNTLLKEAGLIEKDISALFNGVSIEDVWYSFENQDIDKEYTPENEAEIRKRLDKFGIGYTLSPTEVKRDGKMYFNVDYDMDYNNIKSFENLFKNISVLQDEGLGYASDGVPNWWFDEGSSTLCSYVIDFQKDKFGDVDGDSELTAMDASYVLMHYSDVQTGVEIDTNTSDYGNMTIFGDYNGDGTVDALDASEILTVYAENQTK